MKKPEQQERETRNPVDDPLPADKTGQKLLKYFDHRWYHLRAKQVPKGKKPQWKTETRYRIKSRNLWRDWLKANVILGLGFGNSSMRLVIDIDIGSPYHPNNNYQEYERLIATLPILGLDGLVVIRSSWSGGLHLYFFFDKPMPSYYMAYTVKTVLAGNGFKVKEGWLEIFPNTKAYGLEGKQGKEFTQFKAHRLPLQPETGSSILSSANLEEQGSELEKLAELAEESAAQNDTDHLERMIDLCKAEKPRFWDHVKKRGKVKDWRVHLNDFIEEGWTDYHQTNILLKKIGVLYYVFEEKTGGELVEAMVEKAKSLPGYRKYCRHQHEIRNRCKDWAKSIQRFYEILYRQPERKESYRQMFDSTSAETPNQNEQKAKEASNRIKQAYDYIVETVKILPQKITEWMELLNKIAKELTGKGLGKNTLFKKHNLPLWHPKYKQETQETTEGVSDSVKQEYDKNDTGENTEVVSNVEREETDKNTTGSNTEVVLEVETSPLDKNTPSVDTEVASSIEVEEQDKSNTKQITEEVKENTEEDVIQEELQAESNVQGESSEILRPKEVVCEREPKSEELESVPGENFGKNSQTQGYMKGFPPPSTAPKQVPPQGAPVLNLNETKGGSGGNWPGPEGENQAKAGLRGENSSGESASADEQEKAPRTMSDIRNMLKDEFLKAIRKLPQEEQWKPTGERLKAVSKAKKMAKGEYLGKPRVEEREQEICELWWRMQLLKRTGIPALQAEVAAWLKLIEDGVVGDISPPPFWQPSEG